MPADGPLTGDDLRRVGFTTAWFGYRKSEVDTLLRRLALELEERETPFGTDAARDTPEATPGGTEANGR